MSMARVKDAYDRVYRECGYKPGTNAPKDRKTKSGIEQLARIEALVHLDSKDRTMIEDCVERLIICSQGTGLGEGSAINIIQHLGIFFLETGYGEGKE